MIIQDSKTQDTVIEQPEEHDHGEGVHLKIDKTLNSVNQTELEGFRNFMSLDLSNKKLNTRQPTRQSNDRQRNKVVFEDNIHIFRQ